ncbi:MAG: DHHA1 domain-containing protein [Eubacteriales bacterium]|nr:DHHA1 domain-containing protein [Eubacteriales bacterium]
MEITLKECIEYLSCNDNYLIFTHAAPDGDTLGSAFALKYALEAKGKKVKIFNPDAIPARFAFMAEGVDICREIPEGDYTRISIDIASPAMLKGLDEDYLNNLVFDLSIDHHFINTIRAKRLLLFAEYPAAGEIAAEITKGLNVPFDKTNALWLYAAISSDSGCFRFSSTRPETHLTAAELLRTGIDFAKINRRIFEYKTEGQLALERDAYGHIEKFFGGKVAIVCLSDAVLALDYVDGNDIDQINNIPRQIAGVEVSALIRRYGDEIKVSFRSNDYYDVAALAKSFGGGGHIHAAGCRFYTSTDDAKQKILDILKKDFDRPDNHD